ncbi:hypothetical protein AB3N59_20295 (plasmid) [Leptospira sp. WS92.C1]
MKNEILLIRRGRSFQKFFPSSNLEGATVFASFGKIKTDGTIQKRIGFETEIVGDGYLLKMNQTDTTALISEILSYDVLVERPDVSWPEGKKATFEFGGIIKVE